MSNEIDSKIDPYLSGLKNETRAADARKLLPIMQKASGYRPWLSGTIIGFGQYHYEYESGHCGDCFVTGFAPRAQNTVIYIMPGFTGFETQLELLGKHKLGKSCLYLGALKNINLNVLADMVRRSVEMMQSRYDCIPSPERAG